MAHPDVLVIGGGLIGTSIAWRLAQGGCRVTVVEAGRLGGQASWAGAGMLAPGGEVERDSPWARRSVESLRMYPEFVFKLAQESGRPIDFRPCGALELAYEEHELRAIQAKAGSQEGLGIASASLDRKQALDIVPALSGDGLLGATFYPDDAIVDPRELMTALDVVLRARGVEIREHSPLDRLPDSGLVVLAAGAWSTAIAKEGPVAYPVKGHLVGYDLRPGTVPAIVRHGHTYVLQRSSGFIIAGSTTEHAGFDSTTDPAIVAKIHARARRYLPGLLRTSPDSSWAGLRPAVEGDEPQVGPGWRDGLWLAYGHYRNGILLAPITSSLVAAGILRGEENASL